MTNAADQQLITVESSRFGPLEVPAEHVIYMPHGLVGFPHQRRYIVVQHRKNSPLQWLQSVDQPDLAFVVASPLFFDPNYEARLGKAETNFLQIKDPQDLQIWVLVTIPHGQPEKMTANLKAPVVINLANRLAAQVILEDPRYNLRHTLTRTATNHPAKARGK